MNALVGLLILAGIIYGLLVDPTFWIIYSILATLYTLFVTKQVDPKENPKRKTILISTWGCKYHFIISNTS